MRSKALNFISFELGFAEVDIIKTTWNYSFIYLMEEEVETSSMSNTNMTICNYILLHLKFSCSYNNNCTYNNNSLSLYILWLSSNIISMLFEPQNFLQIFYANASLIAYTYYMSIYILIYTLAYISNRKLFIKCWLLWRHEI